MSSINYNSRRGRIALGTVGGKNEVGNFCAFEDVAYHFC